MEFNYDLRISKERVAVLIGKAGTVKKKIETETKTELLGSALTAFQMVNGSREYVASPGEELFWEISWQNSLSESVGNVILELELDSAALDLNSLEIEDGRFDQFRKTIIWDSSQNNVLKEVRPSEGGKMRFKVRVKNDPPFNSAVVTTAKILGPSSEALGHEDVLEIKVSSRVNISARGFYYNSYFTNSGPIPPKVGQTTTYTIIWQVFNGSNELKGARVKAILPGNVQWLGMHQPANENIVYNNLAREVVWLIDSLEAEVGLSKPPKEIRFGVALTPEALQANQAATLVSGIAFEGFDIFSGLPVKAQATSITTQLPEDLRVGYTGGIVQP